MLINPMPLAETAANLQNEQLNLTDYLNDLLDRLEVVEPQVQSLLPEQNRRERLLAEAAVLEKRYPSVIERPPLYGIPIGVKDIYRVDGFPTRGGSSLPPEALVGPETVSVTKLKEAGALILGKTVTTEFAYFEPGPTRNPHNLKHTPGGSSSGSAAAVAAGLSPLTLGTQTIGSVVRPAAFCGVIGFKPSYNRIDPGGLLFVSPSLDHVGLFTQDIAGMNLAASVLCNNWQNTQVPSHPILGVPEGPYLEQASAEGQSAFEGQIAKLEAAGYTVKRLSTLNDINQVATNHLQIMAGEMARQHATLFNTYGKHYRPRTVELIEQGQAVSDEALLKAKQAQANLRLTLENQMDTAGIDLWLTPSAPGPAPKGISATGNPAMNLPWTQAGLPALNLPAGSASNGLPLGLQIIAKFMADENLLNWATLIRQILSA